MARDIVPGSSFIGPPGVLTLFGADGLVVQDPGDVHTDIYGLETCTAIFKAPEDRFDLVPLMFIAHPLFTYLNMERRRLEITPGYLIITGEFAGIPADTVPIYELSLGVADEPIESHPSFVDSIGGSPSNPLNGAYFIDPATGGRSTDNSSGEFSHFTTTLCDGTLNTFAGISAYFSADQITWRERYVTTGRPSDATSVGHIQNPAGPYPTPPSGGNWLYASLNYEQRGLCYFVTKEWRASGRRQWNSSIYS
jgi:hypothetical protein